MWHSMSNDKIPVGRYSWGENLFAKSMSVPDFHLPI